MTIDPIFSWVVTAIIAGLVLALPVWRVCADARRRRAWLARLGMAGMLVLVLLQPGIGGKAPDGEHGNVDVFFVADTTPSIVAEDYNGEKPRLDGVKRDIRKISRKLAGARFSLITFDSDAVVRMPLTTDATALQTAVEVIRPEAALSSSGSSISNANRLLARQLLDARDADPTRRRVVVYLGDGEQTIRASPRSFAKAGALTDSGAVLGYGTAEGGKMREANGIADDKSGKGVGEYIMDHSGGSPRAARSRIDEMNLRAIADQLDAAYTHRTKPAGIDDIVGRLTDGSVVSSAGADGSGAGSVAGSGTGRKPLYWIPAAGMFLLILRELRIVRRAQRAQLTIRKAMS